MQRVYFCVVFLLFGNCFAANSDEQYLNDAKKFLDEGEIRSAVIQLKNLLKESPLNANGRVLLGKAYIKIGDGASAVKELEKARELRLRKEQWIISLAEAYMMVGKTGKVLNDLQLDDTHPKHLRAHLFALKGNAYLVTRNIDSAKNAYNEALSLDPRSGAGFLGKATLAVLVKKYDEAIDYANKAIEIDSGNIKAWTFLGEVYRFSQRFDEAQEAFTKAIDLAPSNSKARIGRAMVLVASKRFKEAQSEVDKVKELVGDIPAALYLEGFIAYQNKKFEVAEELLLKVVAAIPDHRPSQLLLGTIAYSKNKLEIADSYLSNYVKAVPNHMPANKLLAAVKMKLKQPKEALKILLRMESNGEEDPQFLALLGSAYIRNRDFDKGTEKLTRASELAPNVASIRAQLALGQIAVGELDKAVGELESAVQLDQGLMQADVLLVMTLMYQKKYDNAITVAESMLKKTPDNPMPTNLIAAALMAKGEVEQAEQQWERSLSIDSDYLTAALNLARLEGTRKDYKKALEWFDYVLARQPNNINALIGLAQLAERQKDYKKMAGHLEYAREKNPNAIQPMIMLTKYYLATRKPLKALEIARDAYSRHPDNLLTLQNLGLAQSASGQASNALATFRKLINKAKDNPEYHFLYAQELYKDGQAKQADGEWAKALSLNPAFLQAAVARAEGAFQNKEYSKALQISVQVREHHPKSPVGYRLQGEAELGLGHRSKALSAFQQGYKIQPTSPLAQRLFQLHRGLGHQDTAFSILEGWLKTANTDVGSWSMLGLGYQEAGNRKKAISAYERAIELSPKSFLLLNNLAWLYQEVGDSRAVELAERALGLAENNPQVADTVGWIYMQNDREDRGLVLLQQAVVQAPHIAEIRLHLVEALVKLDRKDEARKELTRLLKDKKTFAGRDRANALLDSLNEQKGSRSLF